ncbi:hypothetical protein AVEN_118036-1 [Araneus ventricosus]|uniref:Uncharacterized protein n=1 Tax=Araneus ventricosus TaxID=182803 RepID=A0A4Y2PM20_ARAVE|nr:hypothetical protein AVEN_118036-1 [Araneus ventricosus]
MLLLYMIDVQGKTIQDFRIYSKTSSNLKLFFLYSVTLLLWKVFDVIDGAPAAPVSGDFVYIWMLPKALGAFFPCLLSLMYPDLLTPALTPRTSPQPSECRGSSDWDFWNWHDEHVNVGFSLL